MSSSSRESSTASVTATATVVPPSPTSTEIVEGEIEKEKKEDSTIEEKEESNEPKGDPEVAPIYLKQLLPVFTNVFQSTMLPSVRYSDRLLLSSLLLSFCYVIH